jgi:archaellum component FlaC
MLSDVKQARVAAKDIGDKVADVGVKIEGVDDKVLCVDDKVEVVIDGARGLPGWSLLSLLTSMLSDGKQERVVVNNIGDKVAHMGDKIEDVGEKVDEVDDKVEDIGDQVQCVDEKVQVVIAGAPSLSSQFLSLLTSILSDSKEAREAAQETRLVIQQAASDIDEIKCSWLPDLAIFGNSRLDLLSGNQLIQILRSWLSPADPSTNQNIARKAQHNGTAVWLFEGRVIIEWKATGSLLWIHGKRASLLCLLTHF